MRFASGSVALELRSWALYFLDGFYHSDNLVGFQGTIPSVLTTAGLIKTDSYNGTDRDQRGVVVSVAGFGEANFDITRSVSRRCWAGRYTIDVKTQKLQAARASGRQARCRSAAFVSPVFVHASQHLVRVSRPKFELKYKPTEDVNLYLLFLARLLERRLHRHGVSSCRRRQPALNPEKSQNMEAGHQVALVRPPRSVQPGCVQSDHDQPAELLQQPAAFRTPTMRARRVTGVELESAANVIDNLSLTFNAAYNYGIYTNNVDSFNGVVVNYTGHLLKYLPRWAFTLAGQYVWDLGDGQMATFSAGLRVEQPDIRVPTTAPCETTRRCGTRRPAAR